MATQIEICNSAIAKVRGKSILTLDDNTTEARLLTKLYPRLKPQMLRSHPWNRAVDYLELAPTVDEPVSSEFSALFQLPDDCLRVLKLENLGEGDQWEKIRGNKIQANVDTLIVKGIFDIDEDEFDVNMDEVLAFMLAEQLAYPLTQGSALAKAMADGAEKILRSARSFDSQEAGSVQQVVADEWLGSRF